MTGKMYSLKLNMQIIGSHHYVNRSYLPHIISVIYVETLQMLFMLQYSCCTIFVFHLQSTICSVNWDIINLPHISNINNRQNHLSVCSTFR